MTYDPNSPQAAQTDEPVALMDPVTHQPIGASATLTFAEWCAVDPALVDEDVAAFNEFYPPPAVVAPASEVVVVPSAFARFYGPSAEQKMDRATLEARFATMRTALAPPPPPEDPPAE